MGLSVADRGILDKIIDKEIAEIPKNIKTCRNPENKTKFQLKEPNDFVFGIAFGSIIECISKYYELIEQRSPTQSEMDEIHTVFYNRIAEIRMLFLIVVNPLKHKHLGKQKEF